MSLPHTMHYPEVLHAVGPQVIARCNGESLAISFHTDTITGLCRVNNLWVSVSSDKLVCFFHINWQEKRSERICDVKHKKKLSCVCANNEAVFFGDKTGEIWRIQAPEGQTVLESRFFIGHQATIEGLWCDQRILISWDSEFKVKIAQVQSWGVVQSILLGHLTKILSAVSFKGKVFTCDQDAVLKCWEGCEAVESVKLVEAGKLIPFGEHLLAVAKERTYMLDSELMQTVPVKEAALVADYPHVCLVTDVSVQDVKLDLKFED